MRILIAQSTASATERGAEKARCLCDVLKREGHQLEHLDLPPLVEGQGAMATLASYRLIATSSADVLICLDAVAAVLRHPRKIVCLLDEGLAKDVDSGERPLEGIYRAQVLRAGMEEAASVLESESGDISIPSGSETRLDDWVPLLRALTE